MNGLVKESVLASSTEWTAVFALLLFMSFFVGVCVWTLKQPDTHPDLE